MLVTLAAQRLLTQGVCTVVSPLWVAEFWNTLTSIPLIVIGFYGIWRHHRTVYGLETRFWFSFFAFVGVGAGSVLFHATLWRIGQVLDELPMVWGNSAFIYACITMNDKPGVKRDGIAAATMLVTAAITVFYFKNPDAHAPFLLAYGLGVLALVVLSFRMKALPKECPPLMEISLCSYFFGLLLWVCERTFCSVVQPFQLHAMWHLLAGFGTYSEIDAQPCHDLFRPRDLIRVSPCVRVCVCVYARY